MSVEKIPGGYRVDGLELKNGRCGCTSLAKCCYTWSKVKQKGDLLEFVAKMACPDNAEGFVWGYTVSKDGLTVTVKVEDAAEKETYSGYFPPALAEWEAKGWQVVSTEGQRRDGVVWRCGSSRWLYKEDKEGKGFEGLPEDWKCPACGNSKNGFERIG